MIGSRQGLIVWINSLKHVKYFRKIGNIHYVSKRLRYVVVYLDMSEVERTAKRIQNLPFVKKVDVSYKPFLKTEFENVSKRDNEEKEYDVKIGI